MNMLKWGPVKSRRREQESGRKGIKGRVQEGTTLWANLMLMEVLRGKMCLKNILEVDFQELEMDMEEANDHAHP
jgi:hypothetical protein